MAHNKSDQLISVIQDLSLARSISDVTSIVRQAARKLTGADGATFILREGDLVHYVDEDAIGPLWKGKRFPMNACVSGLAIESKEAIAIEDIYKDSRVPHDAYRPTFVKSMAMMPVRRREPVAAIGNYWASHHKATPEELHLLQSLADSTSIALENVRLYSEMQVTLHELSRQLDLREEFLSVVAHELQTPLTPLTIQSQFLERLLKAGDFRGHAQESQLSNFAAVSKRQLGELTDRVRMLLDVSKIRLDQFDLKPTSNISLDELLGEVVEQFRGHGPKIDLHVNVPAQGHWDRDRLAQLLRIVIGNAVRFGQNKPVVVTLDREDNNALISVRDHGLGIAPEHQARIFARFERAASFKNYGGMGLGLFIAKKIVETHKGSICVESDGKSGSVFTMRLPLKAA